MFYFQTNALGFTPEFLGRVRLAGACASLLGVGVYNFALKDVPLRRMFLWTALLALAWASPSCCSSRVRSTLGFVV